MQSAIPRQGTFPWLISFAAQRHGDNVFLPRRHSRGGDPVTFRELATQARRLSAGLRSVGIGRGDRVGIMSENRYQWLLADLATASLGAIDVPRGADTAPAEMRFILDHSGCRFTFVETNRLALEMHEHLDQLQSVQRICSLESDCDVPGVLSLTDLMREGDAWLQAKPNDVDELAAQVRPEDLLTIVYTSGTTANPKGVMLTHANITSNVRRINSVFEFGPEDRFLSVLPPWHAYERIMDYIALHTGAELVYTDRRRVKDDLVAQAPTVFAAVPRMWESLHDGIMTRFQKLPPRRRALMKSMLESRRRIGQGNPRITDRLLDPILRTTMLKKIHRVTGGRLRVAVSGGGALPAHVDQCLLGLGVPLVNGYGLTETSPVVSVRTPKDNRWGTIGHPLPETTVEIRDDNRRPLSPGETGVIWIRGPGVMQGYYNNAEETDRVLVDGWFNSGDLGRIDPDGQIIITGRAKDTIVLAGGENVEPERLETAIKISPFIEQAVVLGQDRKSLGALLVVACELLEHEISREHWGIDGPFITSKEVNDLIRAELDSLLTRDQGYRSVERIACFRLIHQPMTPENGFLTQTLKVKRHVVRERYGRLIEEMFR